MIRAVTFNRDFRGFNAGARVAFRDGVNLVVGDQGAGKSTLLAAVAAGAGFKRSFLRATAGLPEGLATVERANEARVPAFAFDFEHDNPRVSSTLGASEFLPFQADLASRFMSHGQFALKLLLPMGELREPRFILLDEPDTGLSPASALALVAVMRAAAEVGSQVIAAVHNPWVIEAFSEVLDITHRAFRPARAYLDDQRRLATELRP